MLEGSGMGEKHKRNGNFKTSRILYSLLLLTDWNAYKMNNRIMQNGKSTKRLFRRAGIRGRMFESCSRQQIRAIKTSKSIAPLPNTKLRLTYFFFSIHIYNQITAKMKMRENKEVRAKLTIAYAKWLT